MKTNIYEQLLGKTTINTIEANSEEQTNNEEQEEENHGLMDRSCIKLLTVAYMLLHSAACWCIPWCIRLHNMVHTLVQITT